MRFNIKKALLAGTAIVAVGALAPAAQAADHTLSGNAIWGTVGSGMVATPLAGDNVIMSTHNLGFDPSEAGVLTAGALTSTTGDLTIDTTGDAGNAIFTIGSFTGTSTADITVDNLNASTNRNVAATFSGAVSTGGNVLIRNTEVGANNTSVLMTVGGNYTTTGAGTTQIQTTGTGRTGVTAALDLNGSTNTFAGAVTVTGGAADVTNTSSLLISGASTNFAGGLTLTNGAVGHAFLVMDGAVAQTVGGAVAGNGDMTISNTHASGVTFTGTNTNTGTITMNAAATNQALTFTGDVSSNLSLGDNVNTDTKTATFGGAGATAVSGTIAGGGAADTVALVFTGGNTVTLSGAATSNIDTVAVQSNTTLSSTAALTTSGATTVASGSTLNKGAGNMTVTGGLTNSGTVISSGAGHIIGAIVNNGVLRKTAGAGEFQGAISGTGSLDVDSALTVTSSVSQASADIAGVTVTQGAASGWTTTSGTNFSANGTLALLGGSQTVGGNISNTTDGHGTVSITNVAGTTAFTGNVGTSTSHSLAAFTANGATGKTVTAAGNWYVDATTLHDASTLQFIGTSAQTVSGTIQDGDITVGNGGATDVTFNGVGTSLDAGVVSTGATARYNANSTYGGSYTNTGTTYVAQGVTVSSDEFSNTGTYYLGVVDTNGTIAQADFAQITDSGNNGAITNSRVNLVLTGDVGLNGGAAFRMLTGINLGVGVLADNSIQYTFTTANAGADTNVVVTRTTAASLANGTENGGVATVLDSLNASTNTQIAAIVDNLAKAPSADAFNEILESAGPTNDGGAVVGGFNASVQSVDVNNTRLASLRNGVETGMVAGQTADGLQGWMQGFGQTADQGRSDGVDGYDADTYGMAAGLDTANLLDNATVGVALSYANTDVDSKNANTTEADVDSYQISLYGDYDVAPQTYISGTLGFAWNDIDQTRHNVGGISGLNATADYDSNQYIAYVEAGREFEITENGTLTPHVLAHYQHINIDNYGEDGAGGANLSVRSEDLDIFELGVGAEMAWDVDAGQGSRLRPAISVGYRHDLVGDDVSSTSNFTGGGASFKTNGLEPGQGTGNIGASLGYVMDNNWSFTAGYDYEIKSDYDAHSGSLRANYKF